MLLSGNTPRASRADTSRADTEDMHIALALSLLPAMLAAACAPHHDPASLRALTAQNTAAFFRYRCDNDRAFRALHHRACRPDFERH